MYQGQKVAVVIPAWNEARLIGRTLASVPDYVDDIIVVDDGSDDATAERSALATLGRPGFSLVVLEHNKGVGHAISMGYQRALQRGAHVAVVMGADAQMDPLEMEALIQPVISGDADYVKGDRLAHPDAKETIPWVRRWGNHLLSVLTSWATGIRPLRDSQCGYTAISGHAIKTLPLHKIYPGYGYPNDMLGKLASNGLRVGSVVVRPIYGTEQSGLRIMRTIVPLVGILVRAWLVRILGRARSDTPRPALRA